MRISLRAGSFVLCGLAALSCSGGDNLGTGKGGSGGSGPGGVDGGSGVAGNGATEH